MLYLVTGGSGSGKSEYAERMLGQLCEKAGGGKKLYLAAMMPFGEETLQKIARHREMRRSRNFTTEECYMGLKTFAGKMEKAETLPFVLLECMSNLVANEMFADGGAKDGTVEEILEGVKELEKRSQALVVVTNEVSTDLPEKNVDMVRYQRTLGEINCRLARQAFAVVEVVFGIPRILRADFLIQEDMESPGEKTGAPHLILGGAASGKRTYAEKCYPGITWTDGEVCGLDNECPIQAMCHLEGYIRRWMERENKALTAQKTAAMQIQELSRQNPGMVFLCREMGSGLVPVDAFDRAYREETGRICAMLAQNAKRVERMVCGIPVPIKAGGKRL